MKEIEKRKYKKVKLKVDDEVIVISGKEKGKRGKVMLINRLKNQIIIQGVNKVTRFQRPSQDNPQATSIEIERPLHFSNAAYYDSKSKKGKRIAFQLESNTKVRGIRSKGNFVAIKDKEIKS